MLLEFLQKKYEPFEALRIGQACDTLTELRRPKGQEIRDFDTDFESALRDLETLIGAVNPSLVAHFFLKGMRLPGDKQSQVITGALNQYNYDKLRDSAVASITSVSMLRQHDHHDKVPPGNFQTRPGGKAPFRKFPHKVHEVEADDDAEGEAVADEDETADTAAAFAFDGLPEELLEAFEENEAYITQAKKSRSEMEKARDFYKKPSRGSNPDRIKELKSRLPCVKCGKLGHWKDDPECPKFVANASGVNMVLSGPVEAAAFAVELGVRVNLALLDTACAKSVAGEPWAQAIVPYYARHFNHHIVRVSEAQPFRFGPGPRITSTYALIIPLVWKGHIALWRVSIVAKDVPPLMAKKVLKTLQAQISFKAMTMKAEALGSGCMDLVELPSGHVAVCLCDGSVPIEVDPDTLAMCSDKGAEVAVPGSDVFLADTLSERVQAVDFFDDDWSSESPSSEQHTLTVETLQEASALCSNCHRPMPRRADAVECRGCSGWFCSLVCFRKHCCRDQPQQGTHTASVHDYGPIGSSVWSAIRDSPIFGGASCAKRKKVPNELVPRSSNVQAMASGDLHGLEDLDTQSPPRRAPDIDDLAFARSWARWRTAFGT